MPKIAVKCIKRIMLSNYNVSKVEICRYVKIVGFTDAKIPGSCCNTQAMVPANRRHWRAFSPNRPPSGGDDGRQDDA